MIKTIIHDLINALLFILFIAIGITIFLYLKIVLPKSLLSLCFSIVISYFSVKFLLLVICALIEKFLFHKYTQTAFYLSWLYKSKIRFVNFYSDMLNIVSLRNIYFFLAGANYISNTSQATGKNISIDCASFLKMHKSTILESYVNIKCYDDSKDKLYPVEIGANSIIHQGVEINTNTHIGSHVEIGAGTLIGKGCIISNNTYIPPMSSIPNNSTITN